LIDDLSMKTNILSLNASVEAARAGEQGKGFSVVADSIRRLASQSTDATKTINKVMDEVINKSQSCARLADAGGEKFPLLSIILKNHLEPVVRFAVKVSSRPYNARCLFGLAQNRFPKSGKLCTVG